MFSPPRSFSLLAREREECMMNESGSTERPSALLLAAGADREGEYRGLGISSIAFKVSPPNPGDPFILENNFLAKGSPARHLHYDQEECSVLKNAENQASIAFAERKREREQRFPWVN